MRLVDLQKGMISQKPTYRQKNHASRAYSHFAESQLFKGTYSCKNNIVSSLRHIVSSKIPHHIFCSNPRCSSWRGVYSNGTYLLIPPPWHLLILACHSHSAPHPPRLIGHYQFQQMVLANSKGKGKYKTKM